MTTTMRRVVSNSAAVAAAGRSTLVLVFVLAATSSAQDPVDYVETTTTTTTESSSTATETTDFSQNSLETERHSMKIYGLTNNPPKHKEFISEVEIRREKAFKSILDFNFNVKRIRVLSDTQQIPKVNEGIIYWMNRDQRVQDNWALLYAQKLALQNSVPLHVVFFRPRLTVNEKTYRHFKFMFGGLKKIERELYKLNIAFHFLTGNSTQTLSRFVKDHSLGALVVDFSPLRPDKYMIQQVFLTIGSEIPVIQVDAHNVVPCWVIANVQMSSAGMFRDRINKNLDEYLTEFPPVIYHPYTARNYKRGNKWLSVDEAFNGPQNTALFRAGYIPAIKSLNYFIKNKLPMYHLWRINPLRHGLSNLSPWLHFGHISAQRVLLEVLKFNDTYQTNVLSFKDDVLVRRELADNFCNYNLKYDTIGGAPTWGRHNLNIHRNDTRLYEYTREELENAQTKDFLWNAAQKQMKTEGKTHRMLRSYWAKRILQFTRSPEEAVDTANYLNNKYSLDANDPCGFVGILWAMTGLYDFAGKTRSIFGKIKSVNVRTIYSQFDAYTYIGKYRGHVLLE